MSTWYSNIITKTSSSITTLQRTLLSSEADGDTEDDTHVCRVLRNYYTEKGRPFPGWLPPDPKAPPPQAPVYANQHQVGARYGQVGGHQQQPQQAGGLSSLWGSRGAQGQEQQQQQQQQGGPGSLRAGRGGTPVANAGVGRQSPFGPPDGGAQQQAQGRPGLPSQRSGGSYSSTNSSVHTGAAGGGGGGSAQDRWRQKILGGGGNRSGSPLQGGSAPPPVQSQSQGRYGGSTSQGGGGGGGNYEDRFAPGGMYDSGKGGAGGERPFMAANSPWASNEADYAGGGRGGVGGGLPSNPRRGGGLPSGPRMGR